MLNITLWSSNSVTFPSRKAVVEKRLPFFMFHPALNFKFRIFKELLDGFQ